MMMYEAGTALLFSYGTLRDAPVQLGCFGRLLDGKADAISGYTRSWIKIGGSLYPILDATGNVTDEVAGYVFELTDADLASADAYEGAEYTRVLVRLGSGKDAWVYIRA